MAWWWTSPNQDEDNPSQPHSTSTQIQPTPNPPTLSPDAPQHPRDAPLSRDDQAFSDLKSLFGIIDPERSDRAAAAAKTQAQAPPPDFDPDSLYPTTMSCSNCFDQAYYCSSMAGQFQNMYRYGGMRSCSELWAQWRFCMRTKAMSEDTRKVKIREWNLKKVAKYKRARSSEDVWGPRTEPVEDSFPLASELWRRPSK